jgi:hypothetical protein
MHFKSCGVSSIMNSSRSHSSSMCLLTRSITLSSLRQSWAKGLFKTHAFMDAWSWHVNPLCWVYRHSSFMGFVRISWCFTHKLHTRLCLAVYVTSQLSILQNKLTFISSLYYLLFSNLGAGGLASSSTTINPKRKNLMRILTLWVKVEKCMMEVMQNWVKVRQC